MLLSALTEKSPLLWTNPKLAPQSESLPALSLQRSNIDDADQRLQRFAPLLQKCFPELEASQGIIESPLIPVPNLQTQLASNADEHGAFYLKADHSLPVAGSVKARGGIYEVLVIAENIAFEHGLLTANGDTVLLASAKAKELFSQHTISVGSTGNLGLSIGVMAAALGFQAVVHMSADAKDWKKERLRKRGVTVIEHVGDYASAVAAGREDAEQNPLAHFVDDENSLPLFLGYSVAALRLQQQLRDANITVDTEHPLFVYIPCGVGGAPGGITFGLKQIFGDHVHCFFAEPVDSPCMLVQMALGDQESGETRPVSVYDIGLSNQTEADGLAVGAASLLVADFMRTLVSGVFTVPDEDLFRYLYQLHQSEAIKVEPSATAAFAGPGLLFGSADGQDYLARHDLQQRLPNATHILWTTGGSFVPDVEYQRFLQRGLYS